MATTYKQTIYSGLHASDYEVIANMQRLISELMHGASKLADAKLEYNQIKECPRKDVLSHSIPLIEKDVIINYNQLAVWCSRVKTDLTLPTVEDLLINRNRPD